MTRVLFLGVAFLVSSQISGLYKICTYNYLGNQIVITVGTTDICPLSIDMEN